MKSIDLLVPPETLDNDNSAKLPDNLDSSALIEQMSKTLAEVVEKQTDANKDLAETFKEAITEIVTSNKEGVAEEVSDKLETEDVTTTKED